MNCFDHYALIKTIFKSVTCFPQAAEGFNAVISVSD